MQSLTAIQSKTANDWQIKPASAAQFSCLSKVSLDASTDGRLIKNTCET